MLNNAKITATKTSSIGLASGKPKVHANTNTNQITKIFIDLYTLDYVK